MDCNDITGPTRGVIEADAQRIRVMAGPGTGKSTALQCRVKWLLKQGQDPGKILAVTFTRSAAESLKRDLRDSHVLGSEPVYVNTLHSHCLSLLNRVDVLPTGHAPRLVMGYSKYPIYEADVMISDLISKKSPNGGREKCIGDIQSFIDAGREGGCNSLDGSTDPTDREFEQHLRAWLSFHEALLVDEIIPETVRFLCNNPASDVLSAFDHVIVDEYQDLNPAQQEVVKLVSNKGSLMVVGDADQSIFGFLHAKPSGILKDIMRN